MNRNPLAGIYAAAVTPLRTDGSLDLDSIPLLLEFLSNRGCHGIVLLGTTGEGPSFSPQERLDVFRSGREFRETHPEIRLLAGTGTPSLTETISLTRSAFDLGYDGVLVLPPFYFRKVSEAGLHKYFSEVIRSAVPADGAVLYYNFPSLSGIRVSMEFLSRLRDDFPGQFVGIKDSSGEEDYLLSLDETFGRDFVTMTGTERLFQEALQHNASGCITAPANILSPVLRQAWDIFEQGGNIGSNQVLINTSRLVLEKYLPFPPLMKALLSRLHGFPRWPVRPPLMDMDEEYIEQVLKELTMTGGITG